MEAENRKWKRERKAREDKEERDRADWVRTLKADPDRVRSPEGLGPGEFSYDQLHLLHSIREDGIAHDRDWGWAWQQLIPELCEDVARAYRDTAVGFLRPSSAEGRGGNGGVSTG